MTDIRESEPRPGLVSRRAIARTAAWSVPAVAVVAAAPPASASVNSTTLAVTGLETSFLTLNLVDGGGTLTASALVTVPTEVTITNGPGLVSQAVTVTVTVGRPSGINVSVGRARGFGVYSFNGVQSTSGQRTTTYQSAPIVGQYGFPLTTFTTTLPVAVPSNGSLALPLVLGLAGVSTGLSIGATASYPVTIVVDFGNGLTRTAASTVAVPVGAGIL
ncbi:hypothetical protein [Nocardioides zeae]|uniref:Uncharacterized protein n=1 Tax=Nocardioides zeae TaxID=1457234 RepID=A0A6P0HP59_9ACTN|nr:hypothetical protein [Nocardioides zeae]NEN80386.1 hypothetical protein [Nocardioides zeae]